MTETRMPTETVNNGCNGKDGLLTIIKKQYVRTKKMINHFMLETRMYETMDQVAKYLMSHPVLLVACISILAALIVPILLFIIFAVINVAFAFTGFIVIEMAVLMIGATVLCSILFCMITTIAILGVCSVMTWSVACYILSLLRTINLQR